MMLVVVHKITLVEKEVRDALVPRVSIDCVNLEAAKVNKNVLEQIND